MDLFLDFLTVNESNVFFVPSFSEKMLGKIQVSLVKIGQQKDFEASEGFLHSLL
jgi:hypothetical protein